MTEAESLKLMLLHANVLIATHGPNPEAARQASQAFTDYLRTFVR